MKQGDKIDVTIHGVKVADAEIQEVGDGQVTLVVPGTIVVMATSTSIAPEATLPDGMAPPAPQAVEHQITGVDRVSSDGTVIDSSEGTPVVPAPPVTAPGEPSAPAQDAAQQSVESVVAAENINSTVEDNAGEQNNAVGDTNVPQQ